MSRRVLVFGPAYIDRVLRVDRPLLPSHLGGPLDLSVGAIRMTERKGSAGIECVDSNQGTIEIAPSEHWPTDEGSTILLDRPLVPDAGPWSHWVQGIASIDDLGGMGAGFAAALGGVLVSALGDSGDENSERIESLLREVGIEHRPVRVPGTSADWTLLITSGPFGDKLPIGFRGCHSSLLDYPGPKDFRPDVFLVASMTNALVEASLIAVPARVRVFAATLRNMTDTTVPVSQFAEHINFLCCNRQEWEAMADQEAVVDRIPLISITDGPAGGLVRYRDSSGTAKQHHEPAFPRDRPPRDTNRAGECYASTLISTLLDQDWSPGPVRDDLIQTACRRAAAAAALVIDNERFGFPTPEQISQAIARGRIE